MLEEWITKLRELEAKDGSKSSSARERNPLKRKEEHKEKQIQLERLEKGAVPAKAPPVVPTAKPEAALPVEGREVSRVTS